VLDLMLTGQGMTAKMTAIANVKLEGEVFFMKPFFLLPWHESRHETDGCKLALRIFNLRCFLI